VAHARAKLTPIGRAALVEPVVVQGWPVARAAEAMSVSRATAHKWIRRFPEEGPGGLLDRTSRPRRCPHALPPNQVRRIIEARRRTKHGPHRLGWSLGHPRSTVYAVLRRHGLHRLDWMDRPTARVIRRYEREHPGELIHVEEEAGSDPTRWRLEDPRQRTDDGGGPAAPPRLRLRARGGE
jgi:transposase